MFRVTGKLADKSILKEGTSTFGKWKIVTFTIAKQRNKKKIKLCFTAKGKLADLVTKIPYGEKLDILFYPDCKQVGERWYTEMIVIEVEKYVKQNRFEIEIKNEEIDIEFTDDLQLALKLEKNGTGK